MPLAFDIETEGLDKLVDDITVASVFDPDRDIKKTFFFTRCPVERKNSILLFLQELDDAKELYCFNGIRFDIPFIVHRFEVPESRYRQWILKTFDYFEICKCVFASSCSLNKLLSVNGHSVKTSSGLQAVIWAKEANWKELDDYCMQDTILTHVISRQKRVIIPLTNRQHVGCISHMERDAHRVLFFHY